MLQRGCVVLETATGREVFSLRGTDSAAVPVALAVSPDGTLVAAGFPDGTLALRRTGDRTELRRWSTADPAEVLAFRPDGALLASAHAGGWVRLWDPVFLRALGEHSAFEGTAETLAFSPDGTRLALVTFSPTRWNVDLLDARSPHSLASLSSDSQASRARFSPGGRWLVFEGESLDEDVLDVRILNAATGEEAARLERPAEVTWNLPVVAFSPEEDRAAVRTTDGSVHLFDLGTTRDRVQVRVAAPVYAHVFYALVKALAYAPGGGLMLPRGSEPAEGAAESPATDLLARFLEEAQVTAQLEHPGIVPVHDIGLDAEGRPYFTMRLVRGRSLAEVFDLAREGREGWNVPRALALIVKACEAVAFAHAKGSEDAPRPRGRERSRGPRGPGGGDRNAARADEPDRASGRGRRVRRRRAAGRSRIGHRGPDRPPVGPRRGRGAPEPRARRRRKPSPSPTCARGMP